MTIRTHSLSTAYLACAVGIALSVPSRVSAADESDRGILLERQQIDADFATKLEQLAAKSDELGLPEQAQQVRTWRIPRDPHRTYIFPPRDYTPAAAANESHLVDKWRARFQSCREEHAESLFQLAKDNVSRHPDISFQMLHEVLYENPNHAEARRILGHKKTARGWDVPSKRIKSMAATIPHPQFGWRRGAYWRIDSEHFRITTNHSAKEGIALAERLEEFYSAWRQQFFRFWSSAASLSARIMGRDEPLGRSLQHQVVLFRNRQEYVAQLGQGEPQIAMSLGYYLDKRRTAFFYAGDGAEVTTWLHEATHQLFQESNPSAADVGSGSDFWIVEGIAQYMESFQQHEGFLTVGGIDADRLQFARVRTLSGDFTMPLAQLVVMDRKTLQKEPRIRTIYSHSAGLTHFLMDYQSGIFRAATTAYLAGVYAGAESASILTKETGKTFQQLDVDFKQYLTVTDADLEAQATLPLRRNLCLGRTHVTDQGIGHLRSSVSLEWLDLSFLPVTDGGFASFHGSTKLKQLSLEKTLVTDETLAALARFRQLEELDLSGTAVTDAGLHNLSGLSQLKILWLTNTGVTDQGLTPLEALKQLEQLDLAGTVVTMEGRKRLEKKLPKLKLE